MATEELTQAFGSLSLNDASTTTLLGTYLVLQSRISLILPGVKTTKVYFEGRTRCYWFKGELPLKFRQHDQVDFVYSLLLRKVYRKAWIISIQHSQDPCDPGPAGAILDIQDKKQV